MRLYGGGEVCECMNECVCRCMNECVSELRSECMGELMKYVYMRMRRGWGGLACGVGPHLGVACTSSLHGGGAPALITALITPLGRRPGARLASAGRF